MSTMNEGMGNPSRSTMYGSKGILGDEWKAKFNKAKENPYLSVSGEPDYGDEDFTSRVWAVVRNPQTLPLFLQKEKGSEFVFLNAVMESVHTFNSDAKSTLLKMALLFDPLLGEAFLIQNVWALRLVADLHTAELLEAVVFQDHLLDNLDFSKTFKTFKVQTPDLCKFGVIADAGCLSHIRNATQDLYDLAVQANPSALGSVPKDNQTRDMVMDAVKRNPRNVQYVKSTGSIRDEAQALAISLSLQSLPAPDRGYVSEAVFLDYRERCLKSGYYAEAWMDQFNYTVPELVELVNNMKHRAPHLVSHVYTRLPSKVAYDLALTLYMLESELVIPIGVWSEVFSRYEDTGDLDKGFAEALQVYLLATPKDKSKLLNWVGYHLITGGTQNDFKEQLLEYLIGYDGLWIRFLDKEYHTDKLCMLAVKQNKKAIQYCNVITREVLQQVYMS